MGKGLNSEKTKVTNRMLILEEICTHPHSSRQEIAASLGLTSMTVGNAVAELLEKGVVQEAEAQKGTPHRAGRKEASLSLSPSAPVIAGLWISRDFCAGILSTMDLDILRKYQIDFSADETEQTLLEKVGRVVGFLTDHLQREVLGIGLGAIGLVDTQARTILSAQNFYGIQNLAVADYLEQAFGWPVFIKNDMNAAAMGEKYFGAGKGAGNFAYVGISNGIGAGLVINGKLFEGAGGYAGEIGHVMVNDHGSICSCGQTGCLETEFNVPLILTAFEKQFGTPFLSFEALCRFCQENPAANELMLRFLDRFSLALLSLNNTINPSFILLGHEGAHLSDEHIQYLTSRLYEGRLVAQNPGTPVRRAAFGWNASLYGAATLVLRRMFEKGLFFEKLFNA